MNEWSAGWNEGNGEKKSKAAQTKVMKRERAIWISSRMDGLRKITYFHLNFQDFGLLWQTCQCCIITKI